MNKIRNARNTMDMKAGVLFTGIMAENGENL